MYNIQHRGIARLAFGSRRQRSRAQGLQKGFERAPLFVRGILFSLFMLFGVHAFAGAMKLTWNSVTSPSLAGYVVHYGPSAGNYPSRIDVGKVTSYTIPGLADGATYHFAVTAYDSSRVEGAYSSDVVGVVGQTAPTADFTASTTSGGAPLGLNFTNSSTGSITGYSWAFGDGGTSTAQNPVHVYAAAGTYTVSLTVVGPGGSNTKSRANYITVSSSATSTATATTVSSSPPSSLSGTSVTFTATVTGNAPTGNVAFLDRGIAMAGCSAVALAGSGNARTARCVTSSLTVGTHSITARYGGNSANAPSTSAAVSHVVNQRTSTAWVEDSVPTGAAQIGEGDSWLWVSSSPAPFSGARAHQSALLSGIHQHYFNNSKTTLSVGKGETLYAYVYLDPAHPPSEVMLQWNDGTWEHRAYWGANLIPWGANQTASRRYMGSLPPAGQWVRLAVPAAMVGLEGRVVKGMAFTLYNGRATWDQAGKF
jgi:PKD repeat protein